MFQFWSNCIKDTRDTSYIMQGTWYTCITLTSVPVDGTWFLNRTGLEIDNSIWQAFQERQTWPKFICDILTSMLANQQNLIH